MTEIVKNNSSIKLDILDMGNVGSDQSESEGVFNSLFGGIDANDNAAVLSTKTPGVCPTGMLAAVAAARSM